MKKTTKTAESSLLYRKIDELNLPALERAEAMGALQAANRLADSLSWISGLFVRAGNAPTPALKLRHQ